MKGIEEEPGLFLQIIATGMHLSPTFGLTYKEIEGDGFKIDQKVECLSSSDSPVAIAEATGKALLGCAKAIDEIEGLEKELIIMDRRIFLDDRLMKDEEIDYGQVLITSPEA